MNGNLFSCFQEARLEHARSTPTWCYCTLLGRLKRLQNPTSSQVQKKTHRGFCIIITFSLQSTTSEGRWSLQHNGLYWSWKTPEIPAMFQWSWQEIWWVIETSSPEKTERYLVTCTVRILWSFSTQGSTQRWSARSQVVSPELEMHSTRTVTGITGKRMASCRWRNIQMQG